MYFRPVFRSLTREQKRDWEVWGKEKMESQPEANLKFPICLEIFQDPVILWCSHGFCRACLQRWWTETSVTCPICRTTFLQGDPPQNLALKNLCEAYLLERTRRFHCKLHKENLTLFCVDDLEPVCVVCLHSETHKNHRFKPIHEVAQDYKEGLRKLLKPLQEKSELLNTVKEDFDQTAENIEVQARDTERQIKDVFSILHEFLQKKREQELVAWETKSSVRVECWRGRQMFWAERFATLSETIRETDEALEAENIPFLRDYSAAAQRVQHSLPGVEALTPEALTDTNKHLSNLSFAILDRMKDMIFSTFKPEPSCPNYLQAPAYYDNHRVAQTRRPMSLALPESQARELSHMLDNTVFPPPLANPLFPRQPAQASVSSNVLGNAGGWDLRPAATSVCNEEKSKHGKKKVKDSYVLFTWM